MSATVPFFQSANSAHHHEDEAYERDRACLRRGGRSGSLLADVKVWTIGVNHAASSRGPKAEQLGVRLPAQQLCAVELAKD